MYLVVDCETNGLPRRRGRDYLDVDNWPRAVQVAWCLYDDNRGLVSSASHIVRPDGWTIPSSAAAIHGITTERATAEGGDITRILGELASTAGRAKVVVAHNAEFDGNVIAAEYLRADLRPPFVPSTMICTMQSSTDYCQLPGGPYGQFKWPTLQQLNSILGGPKLEGAHDAHVDANACAYCFFELVYRRVIRLRTRWWQRLFAGPATTAARPAAVGRQATAPRRASHEVETTVISGSGFDVTISMSRPTSRFERDESWSVGAAPGYLPEIHGGLPFCFESVPLLRIRTSESGQTLDDMTIAYVAGSNRDVLMRHASEMQPLLKQAAKLAGGFHRNFVIEPHRIPDLPVVPPVVDDMQFLVRPAKMVLAPLTKTGRVPKFPLSISFSTDPDTLVRHDGTFVRALGSEEVKGDSLIAHLGYLSDGSLGKASLHCWRGRTRWSVDCVLRDGSLNVARVTRGKADGTEERRYDYKEATADQLA